MTLEIEARFKGVLQDVINNKGVTLGEIGDFNRFYNLTLEIPERVRRKMVSRRRKKGKKGDRVWENSVGVGNLTFELKNQKIRKFVELTDRRTEEVIERKRRLVRARQDKARQELDRFLRVKQEVRCFFDFFRIRGS